MTACPWDDGSIRGHDTFLPPDRIDPAVDQLSALSQTPKNLSIAIDYLRAAGLSGGVWLYPGGVHTRELAPALRSMPGVQARGVVDRGGATACAGLGLPIITPEELPAHLRPDDTVLISHQVYEAELLTNLTAIGIPANRIRSLYTSQGYADFCLDHLNGSAAPTLKRRTIRHVVIKSGPNGVMSEQALAKVFPPDETLLIGANWQGTPITSAIFSVVNLDGCLARLPRIIKEINPYTIYLQSTFDGFSQYFLIKRAKTKAKLIFEFWDTWLIGVDYFSMDELVQHFNMPESVIRLNHTGEAALLRHADLIVSKRGGDWPAILRQPHAPTVEYYVGIESPAGEPHPTTAACSGEPKNIVFASSMATPSSIDRFPGLRVNHDHFPVLAALAGGGAARITVFNGSDSGAPSSPFADMAAEMAAAGIEYHARQPLDALRRVLPTFDYGWVRAANNVRTRDHDVVIPATFSSYVSVGLPVVIHDCLRHAAALVRRFNAGVVFSGAPTPEEIAERMLGADAARHRAGAAALRNWMYQRNQDVISQVKKDFSTPVNCRVEHMAEI